MNTQIHKLKNPHGKILAVGDFQETKFLKVLFQF